MLSRSPVNTADRRDKQLIKKTRNRVEEIHDQEIYSVGIALQSLSQNVHFLSLEIRFLTLANV